ncbi:hypothetical protein ACA910_021973 [Epithemia clementina (nom. ined.)]
MRTTLNVPLLLLAADLLSLPLVSGLTKLQVQIPQNLKRNSTGYDHRNALFGMVPYGGSIQQQVYYTEDTLCSGGELSGKIYPAKVESPFILMMDRGDCTFVTKVRNAQHYGAAAVLIADNKCQCDHKNCTPASEGQICESVEPEMADDGSGMDIGIPSFLLFKEDADAFKEVLKANQVIRVEMSFSLPSPDDRVEYDFWSRPGDINSYEFFSNFKYIANALGSKAQFTPHYAIYDGLTAGCHTTDGENQCMTLCTNRGRYCANDPDDDLYAGVSGADVVTEALRRICIWSHYGEEDGIGLSWWTYVEEFMKRCNELDYFASPECILDVYQHAGIDKNKIDLCMRDSGGLEADQNNNKLDNEIRLQKEKGVILVPTSFVNEAKVKGAMSSANIFEAICSGYSEGTKPDICYMCGTCPQAKDCVVNNGVCASSPGSVIPINRADGRVSTHTFASSMFLLICLFGFVGYWYYNRTREEMREQVRGILAEYMPLEDSEDGGVGSAGNFMMSRSAPATMAHQPQYDTSYMQQQQPIDSSMSFSGSSQNGYLAPNSNVDPMRSSLMSS